MGSTLSQPNIFDMHGILACEANLSTPRCGAIWLFAGVGGEKTRRWGWSGGTDSHALTLPQSCFRFLLYNFGLRCFGWSPSAAFGTCIAQYSTWKKKRVE